MRALPLLFCCCCFVLRSLAQTTLPPASPAGRNMDIPAIIRQNQMRLPAPFRSVDRDRLTHPAWRTTAGPTIQQSGDLPPMIRQSMVRKSATPSLTILRSLPAAIPRSASPSPSAPTTSTTLPRSTPRRNSTPSAATPPRRNTILSNTTECRDTSFVRMLGLTNSVIDLITSTHTKDDGVLLAGLSYDSVIPRGYWHENGFIVKTDNNGNILWSRTFDNRNPLNIFSQVYFNQVKELQNGDILVSGITDTAGGSKPITTVFRLDPQGNIVWYSHLETQLSFQGQWMYFSINNMTEGQNGEFLLAGSTISVNSGAHYETVVRLDQAGSPIWDMNFPNQGDYNLGAEGLNAFIDNGNVLFVGMSHGYGLGNVPEAVNFLRLDYTDGHLLSRKFFTVDYPTANPTVLLSKQFTYYYNSARKLPNGHIIVYGPLFSAYMSITDTLDYFGLLEFDAGQQLVNSYSISSRYHTPNENTDIFFDDSGQGLFSIEEYISNNAMNIFFGSVQNGRIARQRYRVYNNEGIPEYPTSFSHFNDGGYLIASSFFDPSQGSYLQFKKLHDTDTSSLCLGIDSLLAFQLPLLMKEEPDYWVLQAPVANQLLKVQYALGPNNIAGTVIDPPCRQKNLCDVLKISGQPIYCGVSQPQLFSVHKNPQCGSLPIWDIDTAVAAQVAGVNDTTVAITFKNVNWQGKLYAWLPAGNCVVPQQDSLALSITGSPQPVALGPDTTICTGNSIVLHAGPAYASYTWQDGTTDSTLKATAPGDYSVDVTDFCGNNSHSAVHISPANFYFSLGPGLAKCNNDTLQLQATGGFSRYQWSPSAALTPGSADSIVRVFPQQDVDYTVQAEKWAGCAVSATVHITVHHSPSIDLGMDTSFCVGGSKTLDAGSGFSYYTWSTGASSRTIVASLPGSYTVMATTGDGCHSYDTLKILNNYPYPVFALAAGADTAICSGYPLLYHFPDNGNNYQWSDGYSSRDRSITLPGNYGLTVTSPNGCPTSHAVDVSVKPSPAVALGKDTTLCIGTDKLLDATNSNAGYAWQDGYAGPVYTVTRAGLYFVTVTINGCSTADSITVGYTGPPDFSLGKDTFLCQGQQFILDPGLRLDPALQGPVTYTWQDGTTASHYTVRDTGTYSLTAGNICGSHSAALHVAPGLCRLVMPSGFTPNHDGRNDLFRVKYAFAVRQFHMIIYNRWGTKVFETANIGDGWDGTVHGAPQPAGTYAWYISLTSTDHVTETAKGTIILIR